MPSIVQIFFVGGERKRRRLEGTEAAAATILPAGRGGGGLVKTSTSRNEQNGGERIPVDFHQDRGVVPPRCLTPSGSTAYSSSSSVYDPPPLAIPRNATGTCWSSPSSVYVQPLAISSGSAFASDNKRTIADAQNRQQEEEKKEKKYLSSAEEDFDSLQNYRHVFGAATYNNGGKRRDYCCDTSSTTVEDFGSLQNYRHVFEAAAYSNGGKRRNVFYDTPPTTEKNFGSLQNYRHVFGAVHNNGGNKRDYCYDTSTSTSHYQRREVVDDASITNMQKRARTVRDDSIQSKESHKRKYYNFDGRFDQLLEFKEEFEHCNVPHHYPGNPSLGRWCRYIKTTYNEIQKEMKASIYLSQDRMDRLTEIGFQWPVMDYDGAFEERCLQLEEFKNEFGHCDVSAHCDVSRRYGDYAALGHWCENLKTSYNRIQKGLIATFNLSQDRMDRLTEIGFEWPFMDHDGAFEKRCLQLKEYKDEFGHCDIPRSHLKDPSLVTWCNNMRISYYRSKKGMKTNCNISQDRIERLEEIGFKFQADVPE